MFIYDAVAGRVGEGSLGFGGSGSGLHSLVDAGPSGLGTGNHDRLSSVIEARGLSVSDRLTGGLSKMTRHVSGMLGQQGSRGLSDLFRSIASLIGKQNPLGQLFERLANLLEGQNSVTPADNLEDEGSEESPIEPSPRMTSASEGEPDGERNIAQLFRAIANLVGRQNPLGRLFTAIADFIEQQQNRTGTGAGTGAGTGVASGAFPQSGGNSGVVGSDTGIIRANAEETLSGSSRDDHGSFSDVITVGHR